MVARAGGATNDASLKELFERTKEVREPMREVFRHFLMAANFALERLVGYQHKERVLAVDLTALTIDNFRTLYTLLLSYFVLVFYVSNPSFKDALRANLFRLVGRPELARRFLEQAEEDAPEDPGALPLIGTPYIETVGHQLYEAVARTIPGLNPNDSATRVTFYLVCLTAYKSALDTIRSAR